MATPDLTALEAFLPAHPTIKYISPSSPDFAAARKVWNRARLDRPLAIVQPQSPADISALVKFSKSRSLAFTLRGGGHNIEGRSVVEGALLIDLRGLNSVTIAPDRKSAVVQGGILQGELGDALWAEGLATPTGSVPSVGYVGWAIYGGYGAFSSHWGLGVDQIIGATVVNPDGEIVTADEVLLHGIRGAGGLFGVVIDLTIKVYPLTSLLAGAIIYDSTDIAKTFTDFNAAYDRLLNSEGLPPQLTIQQVAFNAPPGRVFAIIFVWSGADTDEGERWSAKIAGMAPLLMNTVSVTTIPDWFKGNGALMPPDVYGSGFTRSVLQISPALAGAIGRHLAELPADPGTMFSLHQLRGISATSQSHSSVFVNREPHFMLEILGYAANEGLKGHAEKWATEMTASIEQADFENVLPTSYISLYNTAQAPSEADVAERVYGPKADVLRDLKAKFDPDNVFSLAVPVLK